MNFNNFLYKNISFLFASHLHNIPKYIDINLKNKLYIGHLKTEYDSINKCFIYNRKLTQSEFQQNYYQGTIVTSVLTFEIDAGNLVSYGGVGTTVYDLTTTGVTGTLTNGPIWTYLSGGTFSFDGVDDYVILSSGLTSGTESFTISCFLKYSIPISTTFRDIINNRNNPIINI
jgi:hypothetical protein